MKKLNLGCGRDVKKGWINLDFMKNKGVDVVHDINNFPWPFKDNEIDLVYCSHIIEHLPDTVRVMKELNRICRKDAKIIIKVPHFSSWANYADPTHKKAFSYFTMDYFTASGFYQKREGEGLFKIKKRRLNYFPDHLKSNFLNPIFYPFLNFFPQIYERVFHGIFPCAEIRWELMVVK